MLNDRFFFFNFRQKATRHDVTCCTFSIPCADSAFWVRSNENVKELRSANLQVQIIAMVCSSYIKTSKPWTMFLAYSWSGLQLLALLIGPQSSPPMVLRCCWDTSCIKELLLRILEDPRQPWIRQLTPHSLAGLQSHSQDVSAKW